jgi:hypothetical protein
MVSTRRKVAPITFQGLYRDCGVFWYQPEGAGYKQPFVTLRPTFEVWGSQ